jgi:hypothetical protein
MRYLTKTRFRLGLECPTKLYYTRKAMYPDSKVDDPFLEQLANGGFQVEALARLAYPEGQMIESFDRDFSAEQTRAALDKNSAVLFEASFIHETLHVRSDILVKEGNEIRLIEVKAKSSRSSETIEDEFLGKKGKIIGGWQTYLWDVAFQKYVIENAFPDFNITSYLLLVDKDAIAGVDGIHQNFKITREGDDKRMNIKVKHGLKIEDIGRPLLCEKDVSSIVAQILEGQQPHSSGASFLDLVRLFSEQYATDTEIQSNVGRKCKDCEFHLKEGEEERTDNLDGRLRCWRLRTQLSESEIKKPKPYNIYNSGFSRKAIEEHGKLLATDLDEDDLATPNDEFGFSNGDRQLMHLQDIKANQSRTEVHEDYLNDIFNKVRYPLHMIDFETSAVAIPFTKGMHPYETVAFQYSHHIMHEDGKVEHDQWLMTDPLKFPNFEFVRALKKSLEGDDGSIFRYHNHENTVLNKIKHQLLESTEADRADLISFIQSITSQKLEDGSVATGKRCMIDLHRVISKSYHNSFFSHSLSLKVVLPAIILSDMRLRAFFANPISEIMIGSLNFPHDFIWLPLIGDTQVLDPYAVLPKPFEGYDEETIEEFFHDEEREVANGGTAMMVYAQLQYTEVTSEERVLLEQALLKYCETDTIAMVFIWKHLKQLLKGLENPIEMPKPGELDLGDVFGRGCAIAIGLTYEEYNRKIDFLSDDEHSLLAEAVFQMDTELLKKVRKLFDSKD